AGDDLQQHLGGEVFGVLRLQRGAAQVGSVLDYVVDQAEKAIDKIVPGAGLVVQTAAQQIAVQVSQRHGTPSRRCSLARDLPVFYLLLSSCGRAGPLFLPFAQPPGAASAGETS